MELEQFENMDKAMDFCERLIDCNIIVNYYICEDKEKLRTLLNVIYMNCANKEHFEKTRIEAIKIQENICFIVSNEFVGFDRIDEDISDLEEAIKHGKQVLSLGKLLAEKDSNDISNKTAIDLMVDKVKSEYERIKRKIVVIDLRTKNYEGDLTEAFVINEFLKFLQHEQESYKTDITTYVPMEDYELILVEIPDISDSVMNDYYNTDIGTSYPEFANLLKMWADDIREAIDYEKEQGQR